MNQSEVVGKYVLQPGPLRLTEAGKRVRLSARQLDVLALIVNAQGETVPTAAFIKEIWQGSFVVPGNLTQTVFLIRKAMGKLPDGGEFIETVPKRGYRLAAKARVQGAFPEADEKSRPNLTTTPAAHPRAANFQLLVEAIESYAIYMLDCSGQVLTWNPGIKTVLGYSAEEVLGQHHSLFFVPEDIKAALPDQELDKASNAGKYSGEGWKMRKTGKRFWASVAVSAVRSPNGNLLGYAYVIGDQTERR